MFTNTHDKHVFPQLSRGDAVFNPWQVWWQWTKVVTVGELAGFGIPALVGAAAYALRFSDALLNVAVVVGGIGEGMVLGFAQWLVLRRYVPQIGAWLWVLATAAGAFLAWVLGMGLANIGPALWQVSPVLLVTVAAVLATIFLLSMGVAQWLVLRCYVGHAGWWIGASALAWPLGVLVPVVGLSLVPDGATAITMAAVGILSGMLMGMVVGAITGIAFVYLVKPQRLVGGSVRP